ncbi:MAG: hypothetical protein WCS15_09400 [Prevotella sp.]
MSIEVSNSLVVGQTNTPLDGRCRVDTLDDVGAIPNPFIGQVFFCIATAKLYVVKTLQSKTIGVFDVPNAQVNSYELIATPGGIGTVITKFRLARPYFDASIHLVIQSSTANDFTEPVTLIDTKNVEADRAKVLAFTGMEFVMCPEDGLGGAFKGQTVLVDLSAITTETLIRYKWTSVTGDSDWYSTCFPSSGEAYVANPGDAPSNSGGTTTQVYGANIVIAPTAPVDAPDGVIYIYSTSEDNYDIAGLEVVTTEPATPADGTIWITE